MLPARTGSRGPYAKSAQRRAAIVAAAREVFADLGYRAGSVQAIADRAGMSQSSLLHYFAGKEDLLIAVLRDRDDRGDDEKQGEEGLVSSVLGQARRNQDTPGIIELYTVLCGEAATREHPARQYFAERFARIREHYEQEIRALAAAGVLRPEVDPGRAAAGLVAVWDGIQQQWLIGGGDTDVVAVLRDYLALLFTDEARPRLLRREHR